MSAQTHLSGEIGADVGTYGYQNTVYADSLEIDSDRRLTNQYLDLNLSGPLVNGYFANYSLLGRLSATQIHSNTDGEGKSEYISPGLTNHYGALNLFSERRFPLRFYTGRSLTHTVRYEAANRSQTAQLDPGLAVVRRYESRLGGTGLMGRWIAGPTSEISGEIKQTFNKISRQYDFDENRNIWVQYSEISPGQGPFYNVVVANTMTDRAVEVRVDGITQATIPAESSAPIQVEGGAPRLLLFVPEGLNSFSDTRTVRADEVWRVIYNLPTGSQDLDQVNDVITARARFGGDGNWKNESMFETNSGEESVQSMISNLTVFNNDFSLDFNRNTGLKLLTTYTGNSSDIGVISSQRSANLNHMSTFRWSQPNGLNTSVGHTYAKMKSDTDGFVINSTNNIFNGIASMPTGFQRHQVDVRLNANLLSNDSGYVNDLYSTEVRNRMESRLGKTSIRPRHQFKVSKGHQENPDGDTRELESRLACEVEHPQLGFLGSAKVKGEWSWRKRTDGVGSSIKNRYVGEVGLIRKFGANHRVGVAVNVDKETFAEEIDQPVAVPTGGLGEPTARPDQLRNTFRADAMVTLFTGFVLGANGSLIQFNGNEIRRITASLNWNIPKLNIPLKSIFLRETRELAGLPTQYVLNAETKLSYNFRKVRLVVSHRLVGEGLLSEEYLYNEFAARVSREFDVF